MSPPVSLAALENPNVNTQFTLVVKDRRSYVFNTSSANDEIGDTGATYVDATIKQLANACYSGDEAYIEDVFFMADTGFIEEWNNIAEQKEFIIDYIIIIGHTTNQQIEPGGEGLGFSPLEVFEVNVMLKTMSAKGMIIIGCNAGDVDFDNNIASAFSNKVSDAPVIAADGDVTQEDYECRPDEQGAYDAKGWYIYKSNCNPVATNQSILTISQMVNHINDNRS